MTWSQFMDHVGRDREKVISYLVYGKMFRTLALKFPVKDLVRQAADPGFPATLEKGEKRPRP
jgi:hypothetical protein